MKIADEGDTTVSSPTMRKPMETRMTRRDFMKATGAIILRSDACVGCPACADACPFGMAALHPETGLAVICDLCGGDPACVKRCATSAIVYDNIVSH